MFDEEGKLRKNPDGEKPSVRAWSAHKNTQFDQLSKKHLNSLAVLLINVSPVI